MPGPTIIPGDSFYHTHATGDVTGLNAALDGKSSTSHDHTGVYELANVNIQTHVGSAHAPSNAQKNSDITKAEIEAKLTGEISSHTHAGGGASWGSITGTLSNQTDLQTALDGKADDLGADDNYVTDAEKTKLSNLSGTNTGDQTLPTRASLGLDTTDNPQFAGINLGAVSDTTITRVSAGVIAVEGVQIATGTGTATGTNTGDQTISDATISTTDITTNDASTAKHGFLKKLDNSTTNFMRGDGAWAAPTASVSYTLVATLSSDAATGANTTPISLTGLVFTYATNSVYRIWFMGRVSPAAATTGCGFQFDTSTAVTDINVIFYHQLANTGTLSGGHSIADDASVGVSSGLPGTSTYPVFGQGILRTTGNTGTAQLRFRSETTAVITAKAGLTLVVEKIA